MVIILICIQREDLKSFDAEMDLREFKWVLVYELETRKNKAFFSSEIKCCVSRQPVLVYNENACEREFISVFC